jgi:hypothetical protein
VGARGNLTREVEQSFEQVLQRSTVQILHGDERFSVFFSDVINRADVRMVQCGGSFRFTSKSLEGLPIPRYVFR